MWDHGATRDDISSANVAVGYIKEHYPEATTTETIRFVSTVRSRVEAGVPVDHRKILEELKAQKEQDLG
jgi:hypothetical protein